MSWAWVVPVILDYSSVSTPATSPELELVYGGAALTFGGAYLVYSGG